MPAYGPHYEHIEQYGKSHTHSQEAFTAGLVQVVVVVVFVSMMMMISHWLCHITRICLVPAVRTQSGSGDDSQFHNIWIEALTQKA